MHFFNGKDFTKKRENVKFYQNSFDKQKKINKIQRQFIIF